MIDWLTRTFGGRPWYEMVRDVCDVIAVAFVIYRALLVIRGTRAMQMGAGLVVILLLYLAAKLFALVTLLNLLGYLLSSIILIVVVVFQNDIRRALIRVGSQAWLGRGTKQEQSRVIDEVVAAVTELARHRIGAIIAFEQDANLLEFTKSEGTVLGAAVTRELLVALFFPDGVNKLHDGAVLIRDLKIARAGVFFPMPDTKLLDKSLGSRHRAALGITEETDAVVVVVSEERGVISFCFNGNIVPNLDGTALRQTLLRLLGQKGQTPPTRANTRAPARTTKEPHAAPVSERPAAVPSTRTAREPFRPPLASSPDLASERRASLSGEEPLEPRPSFTTTRRMPRANLGSSSSVAPPHGGSLSTPMPTEGRDSKYPIAAADRDDEASSDRSALIDATDNPPSSRSFVPKPHAESNPTPSPSEPVARPEDP